MWFRFPLLKTCNCAILQTFFPCFTRLFVSHCCDINFDCYFVCLFPYLSITLLLWTAFLVHISKWEREQHWRETHGKQTNLKFSVRLAQFMVRLLHGFSLNSAHWWMHLFKVKISWWVLHTIYGISLNLPERRKDNKTNEISSIFQRHATINEKPYN